jgi:hypothetical protein
LDDAPILNAKELYWVRFNTFKRFAVTMIDLSLAYVNAAGSQSDIVVAFIVVYNAQAIYRFYELLAFFSPTYNVNCSLFHLNSTCGMVFFVQCVYMSLTHVNYHSEKLELAKNYQGELCNLMSFYEK